MWGNVYGPVELDKDMEEFFTDNEEYSYIFRNGQWFAYDMHQFEDQMLFMNTDEKYLNLWTLIPAGSIMDR